MADPAPRAMCAHPDFQVDAHVRRIAMPDGSIGSYLLHVSARCSTCDTPFWFPGLGTGWSFTEPVTNTDGFQVSLPLVPEGRRCDPPPDLVSTIVRNSDVHKGHKRI